MRENKKIRVVCGMSGGVDSAVAAHVLKEEGYDVVGVFMKNWQDDGEGCSAAEDFEDVKSVCNALDIPYYSVNFEQEYQERVFSYFLSEYKRGRTPNPDVLCNAEIKFAAFLDYAKMIGAERLATGHYARLTGESTKHLLKAADLSKDQTYFLCMLNQAQLSGAMFPIGDMIKTQVRDIAEQLGLDVAKKKDSTGICFIGERKFREFLKGFIPAQKGDIKTPDGAIVGQHDGVIYYTLGQRRGLNIGGTVGGSGERWFVVDKDVKNNVLIAEQGETERLFSKALIATGMNYIAGRPEGAFECKAKFRYRQPDQDVLVTPQQNGELIEFKQRQRAVTPGQYAVLYNADECLGGGVIDEVIF